MRICIITKYQNSLSIIKCETLKMSKLEQKFCLDDIKQLHVVRSLFNKTNNIHKKDVFKYLIIID